MREVPVPVIAAINGPAIGAGLCLAVGGADIRVAGDGAKLGNSIRLMVYFERNKNYLDKGAMFI